MRVYEDRRSLSHLYAPDLIHFHLFDDDIDIGLYPNSGLRLRLTLSLVRIRTALSAARHPRKRVNTKRVGGPGVKEKLNCP